MKIGLREKVEGFDIHRERHEWILTLLGETYTWGKKIWKFQGRFCNCLKSKSRDFYKSKVRVVKIRNKRLVIFHKETIQ